MGVQVLRAARSTKAMQFVALTFALSWSVALVMFLLDVRYGSLASIIVIATLYMPAPAYATFLIQKVIHKRSLAPYGLRWRGTAWHWLAASIGAVWAIVLGTFVVIGLLGNGLGIAVFGQVDFGAAALAQRLAGLTGQPIEPLPIPPLLIFGLSFVQASVLGATINLPFTLGEELGWRGLLLHETQSLGFWRSNLLIGVVWGVWHAPLIVQGHNYPDHPLAGLLMMTLFTISLAFMLAYSRIKTRSIWGPAVLHGVLNGLGNLIVLFVSGANSLWGSVPGGAGIAVCGLLTLAITLFDRRFVRDYAALPD